MRWISHPLLIAVIALSTVACGKSGSRETRPVEVLYQVSGPSRTEFRVLTAEEARPECPGGNLRASNAVHSFPGRVFQAPHLFIMENAFQPTSGTFEVLADQTNALRIDLFLGLDQFDVVQELLPGECADAFTVGELNPQPNREYRIEICGSINNPPSGAHCGDFDDAFVGFTLSVGDSRGSNVSSCSLRQVAEACRTPATLFVEQPKDRIDAIIDSLSNENRDAVITVELYIDDELVDSSHGHRNVQVSRDL